MSKNNKSSSIFSLALRAVSATVCLVAMGCSQQPVVEPILADAKFECKDQPIKPGEKAMIVGTLKNKGGEFKGIKITLKGTAISESVLSMPVPALSKLESKYAAQEKLIMSSANCSFTAVNRGRLELTLPDFECKGDTIDLTLAMPANLQGRGDLGIIISPLAFPKVESATWLPIQVRKMTGIFMGS